MQGTTTAILILQREDSLKILFLTKIMEHKICLLAIE
jgi:hypothetical protein